ncbi:XRE family transcriptional regulator [Streptomyces sp. NBC_01304]|uniref:XRE family transcriptional regulator n=1 Tax=Streptomyces sp. NBC_01304 TaxID=2903818 RepID=UPI002E0D714E|nr:XRE family transcriptional regulator [Streptomyces sp. NBC_01304]
MRESGQTWISEALLAEPEMIQACRSRDFAVVFGLARRCGLYPSRIAQQCGMTPSRVGEIASGKRIVSAMDVVERIADGLRIPGAMLGLAARPWETASAPNPFPATPTLVAEPPHPDDATAELRRELATSAQADLGVVRLLAAQTDQMRQMDRRFGAELLLPQLRAQIEQMEHLLRYGAATGTRQHLAAALTEAATLAGWQALDLGDYRGSWDLHETAKAAAHESRMPALLAHATAQQAYVLLDLNEPDQAIEQIRYARVQAGSSLPPLMDTWLHAAEAEAHAAAYADTDCRRALDRAETTRPADPADPSLPFLFLAGPHLDRWRGNCLATLGADEAVTDLTAALNSMSGFTRAEAGVRCDLAVALQRRGEWDEARRQAEQAQQLALATHSARQRRRINQLLRVA